MSLQPCLNCGKLNRPNAKSCGYCGKPLIAPTAPMPPTQPQAGSLCPHCGKPVRPNARFCGACGYALTPPLGTPHYASPQAPVPGAPAAVLTAQPGIHWSYLARHALIASTLFVCLLVSLSTVGVYDANNPKPTPTPLVANTPPSIALPPISAEPQVIVGIDNTGRFGLRTVGNKLLTYSSSGETNNTRIQVDNMDATFGDLNGNWVTTPRMQGTGMFSVWNFRGIETREDVTITAGATTRKTDTIRVHYTMTNRSTQPHNVAIRVMLDTLIGGNDGVPFLFAGENAITASAKDVRNAAVPDYIEALEVADIAQPGTVVNLALRGGDATPPDRLVVSGWYTAEPPWEYLQMVGGVGAPITRGGIQRKTPDSAVGLYYDSKPLAPNASRLIVFYYGLGGIAAAGKLGLTVPLEVIESETFSIIVIVMDARDGQSVRIDLPDSIALASGETGSKNIAPASGNQFSQVSWKLRAKKPVDAATISVKLDPEAQTATQTIKISPCGVTRPCYSTP